MCNPPFYESAKEMARSAAFKELPPNAVSGVGGTLNLGAGC